jgi:hypothetical protein
MGGTVEYGFGLVSEQSVHEVLSGIRDAVNRVTDALKLVIICTNVADLNTQTAPLKFATQKFYTKGQASSVR